MTPQEFELTQDFVQAMNAYRKHVLKFLKAGCPTDVLIGFIEQDIEDAETDLAVLGAQVQIDNA